MPDLSTIGIKADYTDLPPAAEALDKVAEAGARAETATESFTKSFKSLADQSSRSGIEQFAADMDKAISAQGRMTEEEARYWANRRQGVEQFRQQADAEAAALNKTRGAIQEQRTEQDRLNQSTRSTVESNDKWIEQQARAAIALGKTRTELLALEGAQRGLTQQQQEDLAVIIKYREEFEKLQAAKKGAGGRGGGGGPFGPGGEGGSDPFSIGGLVKIGTVLSLVDKAIEVTIGLIKDSVLAFLEWEHAQVRLQAMLEVTGNRVGRTSEQINKMADDLRKVTTFDDTSIVQAATSLLKFGDLTGETFDRALKASADLATIMGTDVTQAAELVGRALENSYGVTSLRRMGLLTDAQVEYLKALKEARGESEYQNALLTILEEKSRGAAEAVGARGLGSAWAQLRNEVNNTKEETGKAIVEFVNLEGIIRGITETIRLLKGENLPEHIAKHAKSFSDLLPYIAAATVKLGEYVNLAQLAGKLVVAGVRAVASTLPEELPALDPGIQSRLKNEQAVSEERRAEALKKETAAMLDSSNAAKELDRAREAGKSTAEKRSDAEKRFNDELAKGNKVFTDAVAKYGQGEAAIAKAREDFIGRAAKDTAKGASDVSRTMQTLNTDLLRSQQALLDLGKTAEDKTVPALRKLAELKLSDTWKTMSADQRANAIAALEATAANQRLLATLTEQEKQAAKNSAAVAQYSESLVQQKDKFDAQAEAIANFGTAQAGSAEATLKHALAHGKLAEALDAEEKRFPGIREAWERILTTQARAADEAQRNAAGYKAVEKAANDVERALQREADQMERQIDRLEQQTREMGLTRAEVDNLRVAETQAAIATLERVRAMEQASDFVGPYNNAIDAQIERLTRLRNAQQGLANKQNAVDEERMWGDVFKSAAGYAEDFLQLFTNKSHQSFADIGKDLLRQLTDAMVHFAAQTFVVNIAGVISPELGGIASKALGGSNSGLSGNLFTGGGAGSIFSGPAAYAATVPGLTTAAAGSQAAFLAAQTAEFGIQGTLMTASAGGSAAAGIAAAGGVGAIVGAAVPVIGAVLLAAYALGAFDKEESEAKARFQFSTDTEGFEENRFTKTPYGNIGFADEDTAYISGELLQNTIGKQIEGLFKAVAQRQTPEQIASTTDALQSAQFSSREGTTTTEDFIKEFGGDALKEVAAVVFDELNPALGSAVRAFKGTADEVANFANTLLAVHDATERFRDNAATGGLRSAISSVSTERVRDLVPSEPGVAAPLVDGSALEDRAARYAEDFVDTFVDNIGKALADGTQETADKVLAFVSVVNEISVPFPKIAASLASLSPDNILAFVEAMGGADQMIASFAFFDENFTTSTQHVEQNSQRLSQAWDRAGEVAGLSAADFEKAGISGVKTHDDFVKLIESLDDGSEHGRALTAVLLNEVAPALITVIGSAEEMARKLNDAAREGLDVYRQNFLTPDEQKNLRIEESSTALYGLTQPGTRLNEVFKELGFKTIPTTVEQTRRAHDAILAKYGAESDEYKLFLQTIPIIYDLNDAVDTFTKTLSSSIVSVQSLVDAGKGVADELLGQIRELADASVGDYGEKLATQISLIAGALDDAKGVTFGTTFDRRSRQFVTGYTASSGTIEEKAYANTLITSYNDLKDHLARFTTLSVQYDAERAEQLVALQDWYNEQSKIFTGNDEALAALGIIFQRKWDAIVNGAETAAEALDAFIAKVKQLADSTQGDAGQQARLEQSLIQPKIAATQTQLAAAAPGSPFAAQIQKDLTALTEYNAQLTTNIQHFAQYREQHGTEIANQLIDLENSYEAQKKTATEAGGTAETFAILAEIFNQNFQKIVTGADEAASAIEGFIDTITRIADDIGGDSSQQARLELALTGGRLATLQTEYAKLDPTSEVAKAMLADITKLKTYNDDLIGQIANFAIYTAQFNRDTADQLVELENWYKAQQRVITENGGGADALAVLAEVYGERRQEIIDAFKGAVDGSLEELERLRQGIRDYLKDLAVGDLSPLSPQEQLAQAKRSFEQEYTLAFGGDTKALGDITQFADEYLRHLAEAFTTASTPYREEFAQIQEMLAALAQSTTTGELLPAATTEAVNAALTAALPTNSKIASSEDVVKLAEKLIAGIQNAIGTLIVAQGDNADRTVDALEAAKRAILESTIVEPIK